jgi:NADH-quinone oxidoreductase subunit E
MSSQEIAAAQQLLGPNVRQEIESYFSRYPDRRAALLPALHLVQQTLGYVPEKAVQELAEIFQVHPAEIEDVVSFYSFFKRDKPLGKYRIWVCRSLSCACRGGEELLEYLSRSLGIAPGETTEDGLFTLEAAECLGVCEFAPAILINDRLEGHLSQERAEEILRELRREAKTQTETLHSNQVI